MNLPNTEVLCDTWVSSIDFFATTRVGMNRGYKEV